MYRTQNVCECGQEKKKKDLFFFIKDKKKNLISSVTNAGKNYSDVKYLIGILD